MFWNKIMLEAPATPVCIWGRALKAIWVGPGKITLRLFIPNVSLSIDFSSFSISLLSHWSVLSLLYLHVCPSIYPSPHLQKCTIRYNVFISVTSELCKCGFILYFCPFLPSRSLHFWLPSLRTHSGARTTFYGRFRSAFSKQTPWWDNSKTTDLILI